MKKEAGVAAHSRESGKETVCVSVEDPNILAMIYGAGVENIQDYSL